VAIVRFGPRTGVRGYDRGFHAGGMCREESFPFAASDMEKFSRLACEARLGGGRTNPPSVRKSTPTRRWDQGCRMCKTKPPAGLAPSTIQSKEPPSPRTDPQTPVSDRSQDPDQPACGAMRKTKPNPVERDCAKRSQRATAPLTPTLSFTHTWGEEGCKTKPSSGAGARMQNEAKLDSVNPSTLFFVHFVGFVVQPPEDAKRSHGRPINAARCSALPRNAALCSATRG
jgi:hypothetical protein